MGQCSEQSFSLPVSIWKLYAINTWAREKLMEISTSNILLTTVESLNWITPNKWLFFHCCRGKIWKFYADCVCSSLLLDINTNEYSLLLLLMVVWISNICLCAFPLDIRGTSIQRNMNFPTNTAIMSKYKRDFMC